MPSEPGPESSDVDLLRRFQAGDDAAFTTLVGRYAGLVYVICRRVAGSDADAHDASQTTFWLLARQAGADGPQRNLAAWLQVVATRTAANLRRAAQRRRQHEGRMNLPEASDPAPVSDEFAAALHEHLATLSESDRNALMLHHFQDCSHEEAALEMGVRTDNFRQILHRAHERLRQRLLRAGFATTSAVLVSALSSECAASAAPLWATRLATDSDWIRQPLPARLRPAIHRALPARISMTIKIACAVAILIAVGLPTWSILSAGEAPPPAKTPSVPLGHPDFYPSPENPIGWRGDRTGAFPGASPVANWDSKSGQNIAWKTRMPSPSWGQPIVVGEKVFTTADPNLLICVSAKDGKILWQQEVDHTVKLPPAEAKKAKEELAYFAELFPIYVDACRAMAKLQDQAKAKGVNDISRGVDARGGAVDPHAADWIKTYKNPELDKALSDPAFKTLFDQVLELRKKYGFNFIDPHRGDNWSAIADDPHNRDTRAGMDIKKRAGDLIDKYSIWPWTALNWYNCTTMTFATPCSDGRFVYVAFPSNQVACYDLDGKQQWLVWEHPPAIGQGQGGPLHTRFVASPVLANGILVVNQNSERRAYDCKTGKKLWSVIDPYEKNRDKRDKTKIGRDYRPFPEGCSPVVLRLPCKGKTLDVVADGGGKLYRLTDGKVVCSTAPVSYKGQSQVPVGDVLVWKSGGDGRPYPIAASRLTAVSEDEVTCAQLWSDDTARAGEDTAMVYNGTVYNDNGAWELLTGKKLAKFEAGSSWNSPILAGNVIAGAGGSSTITLKEGNTVTKNVLEDDIAKLDPEWDRKVYCGQAGPIGNGSWYAAGNRLFFRTAGHLWCIGDPKQAFVGPKDCPPAAKAK